MNQTEISKLIRTVWKNVRCPQCGKQYSFSEIKIRGVLDNVCFLELNCQDHMPLIATVFINSKKQGHTENYTLIDADDVIDTHIFLQKFQGGFKKIFDKQ